MSYKEFEHRPEMKAQTPAEVTVTQPTDANIPAVIGSTGTLDVDGLYDLFEAAKPKNRPWHFIPDIRGDLPPLHERIIGRSRHLDVIGGTIIDRTIAVKALGMQLARESVNATVLAVNLEEPLTGPLARELEDEGVAVLRAHTTIEDWANTKQQTAERLTTILFGSPDPTNPQGSSYAIERDVVQRMFKALSVPDPDDPTKSQPPTLNQIRRGLELAADFDSDPNAPDALTPDQLRLALNALPDRYSNGHYTEITKAAATLSIYIDRSAAQKTRAQERGQDHPATLVQRGSHFLNPIGESTPKGPVATHGFIDFNLIHSGDNPGADAAIAINAILLKVGRDAELGIPTTAIFTGISLLDEKQQAHIKRTMRNNGVRTVVFVHDKLPSDATAATFREEDNGLVILATQNGKLQKMAAEVSGPRRKLEKTGTSSNTSWSTGESTNEGTNSGTSNNKSKKGQPDSNGSDGTSEGESKGTGTSEGKGGGSTTTFGYRETTRLEAESIGALRPNSGDFIILASDLLDETGKPVDFVVGNFAADPTSGTAIPLRWRLTDHLTLQQIVDLEQKAVDRESHIHRPRGAERIRGALRSVTSRFIPSDGPTYDEHLQNVRATIMQLGPHFPVREFISGVDLVNPEERITPKQLEELHAAGKDTATLKATIIRFAEEAHVSPRTFLDELKRHQAISRFAALSAKTQYEVLQMMAKEAGVDPDNMREIIERDIMKVATYEAYIRARIAEGDHRHRLPVRERKAITSSSNDE